MVTTLTLLLLWLLHLLGKPSEVDQGLALIKESLCDHYKNVIGWLQPLAWNASFHIHIKHIFTNLEMVTELQQGVCPLLITVNFSYLWNERIAGYVLSTVKGFLSVIL